MSALPCPVADPFVAADQVYATITEFLRSKEACQVKHSELERQLEGMSRELMRKLLQAHLELRQPGQAVEPVRDAAGTPLERTAPGFGFLTRPRQAASLPRVCASQRTHMGLPR